MTERREAALACERYADSKAKGLGLAEWFEAYGHAAGLLRQGREIDEATFDRLSTVARNGLKPETQKI